MAGLHARDFDLHQLAIFCKIVELASFSRAAETLFLTQPTLSAHIANLERAVSTRLLDRLGRSVAPTRAGRTLYQFARKLLDLKKEALEAIDAEQGLVRGNLIAGGSTIPGVYILPAMIGQFKKKYPGVRVTLRLGDSAEILDLVERGEIEMALVGQPPAGEGLSGKPFGRDLLVLIVPSGHPLASRKKVAPEHLKGVPYVTREPGSGTRRFVEAAFSRHGLNVAQDLDVVCELGSTEAVKQAVQAEVGVSIVSRRSVESEVKQGLLSALEVEGIPLERRFYMVHHAQRTLSPLAQAFIKFVMALKG